jgi:nucleotide-binding universal stress UspA family protein
MEKLAEQGRDLLANYKQNYQTGTIHIQTAIADGIAAEVICDKAENEQFDLIVIGSRGLSTGARILLGSVSGRVSRRSHCPVLIVR